MSASLQVRGVSFSYGPRDILRKVDLTVAPGMRVGVLGPNGVGKSTLLGVLSGRLQPDEGSILYAPATATIGELRQETERVSGETVEAYLARRTGVSGAQTELDAATEALSKSEAGSDDRYSDALERWLDLGAADFESRVQTVMAEVGLADATLGSLMTTLSSTKIF